MHKLKINDILHIGYCWLAGMNNCTIGKVTGNSNNTVISMMRYFRQLVCDSLDLEDCTVGGEGVVVEIDEAKFGKRKFNVGHKVDGAWVLGGIERTPERRVFLVEVPNRAESTLLDVVSRHVLCGSIVHTDCFRSYHNLCDLFEHMQVNHSKNFRDPLTGCHTNTIEGTWNGVKMKIAPRSRVSGTIDDHLGEFIWRRKWSHDIWGGFIGALRETLYLR